MNRMKLIPLFVMLTVIFAACGGGGESSAPQAAAEPAEAPEPAPAADAGDAALIAEGEALFGGVATCAACHGPDATGTAIAPNLTDDQWLNIEAPPTAEKIQALIRNGVAEPKEHPAPMPPMANLTDDQVAAVAAYVMSL